MTLATPTRRPWITQKRCVGCGLRAEAVEPGAAMGGHCPRCGVDWGERPPRSYAELEGFEVAQASVEEDGGVGAARVVGRGRPTRLLRVLEVGLFVLLIVVALAVASANIVSALRAGGDAAGM